MMGKVILACCGYSAPDGNDILTAELERDGRTAVLSGIRQGDNPSFCLEHDGFLYTVSEGKGDALIQRYRMDGGALIPTADRIRIPGGELCHLYAGQAALYASCYETGDFCAVNYGLTEMLWHRMPRPADREEASEANAVGGKEDRQAGPHAHWITEWDGILYLTDLGNDRIYRYRLKDGLPEEELSPLCLEKGAGPRQVLPFGEKDRILSVQELDGTLRLWQRRPAVKETPEGRAADAGGVVAAETEMVCVQKVRTTASGAENYPGTVCMADENTVLVCNRGANTVAAFTLDENGLTYTGEWETGNWPRYIKKIPGTDLVVNACNEEGVLAVFAWEGGRLERRGEIRLHGASGVDICHI